MKSSRLSGNPVGKRLSICHIIFRLDFGGMENSLANLINRLPVEEFSHSIICLTYATEFRQRIQQPDLPVFEVHKRDGKDVAVYGSVWKILWQVRPEIVHTRNFGTIDMLAPAFLAGVRRFVHSEHGLDVSELDGRNRRRNQLRLMSRPLVDRYITVSHDLACWLNKDIAIPLRKIAVIHNGVDTIRFSPGNTHLDALPAGFAGSDSIVIGTIGRLQPIKDQVTLTQAFIRLLALRPDLRSRLRLVIVGDGPLRSTIEKLLTDSRLTDLAWMPGFREETAEIYRALSIFVLPSRREGISNTALEAMATGLPIVATNVGGNPEIIEHEVTGLLSPPGDPEAMARMILRYLEDPRLSASHGQAGRIRAVQQFSLSGMAESYGAVYRSVSGRYSRAEVC